jgi:tetratricopeptide (TPR) repeat protein
MSTWRERYDGLLAKGRQAFATGEFDEAYRLLEAAECEARDAGDEILTDRARYRKCFVEVERGNGIAVIPPLQAIYMGSPDLENRCMSAYSVAAAFFIEEDLEKATRWAGRATELAEAYGDPSAGMIVTNLDAALRLRRSEFEVALQSLNLALEFSSQLSDEDLDRAHRAQINANLGYCQICLGNVREGLRLAEGARATFEEIGARHYIYENLQDLCYGYILDDQLDPAQECGETSFDLAVEYDDPLIAKNCLFLLSEVAVRRGDTFRARRYLKELTTYYPELGLSDEIVDVFLTTDLTQVVNLRG